MVEVNGYVQVTCFYNLYGYKNGFVRTYPLVMN